MEKEWMKELREKRKCMRSAMIVVETHDNRRSMELITEQPKIYREKDWLLLESITWAGSKTIIENADLSSGNKVEMELSGTYKTLFDMLGWVEQKLTTEPTALIIKNIVNFDPYLTNVLYSWAKNTNMMMSGSTIILFVENIQTDSSPIGLPQSIVECVDIIRPVNSTMTERESDVQMSINIGLMEQKHKDELVKLLDGLNLDQIDLVLTNIAIRHTKMVQIAPLIDELIPKRY